MKMNFSLGLFLLLSVFCVCFGQNPFTYKPWYVNPSYKKNLDASIATATGKAKENMMKMREVPSAYWIDVKKKIRGNNTDSVEGILSDAASHNPSHLVVFIVYDLPNRDCNAKASNGEICCYYNSDRRCNYLQTGDCKEGINEYKTTYIDPLAQVFSEYQDKVPIVLIIEPDSLPNLATNLGNPACGNTATQNAYKQGITYAVTTFKARAPKVSLYMDAAHGGWLGWENNMSQFASLVRSMFDVSLLRGFATNVANYQTIGKACPRYDFCLPHFNNQNDPCCYDPCKLATQYNPSVSEENYALHLQKAFGTSIRVLIDSGRNGVPNMRSTCANWCNIRNAGVGVFPTTSVPNPTIVDAYYWLKTPGESDGCTRNLPCNTDPNQACGTCPRYDEFCGSVDSIGSRAGEPFAPEAGRWFDYQIKQLAEMANFNETKYEY